jgi:hypothetical protein
LPLTPVLILKATLGQKPKNQPLSSLIILKKSPAIIVTGNIKAGSLFCCLRSRLKSTHPRIAFAQQTDG